MNDDNKYGSFDWVYRYVHDNQVDVFEIRCQVLRQLRERGFTENFAEGFAKGFAESFAESYVKRITARNNSLE